MPPRLISLLQLYHQIHYFQRRMAKAITAVTAIMDVMSVLPEFASCVERVAQKSLPHQRRPGAAVVGGALAHSGNRFVRDRVTEAAEAGQPEAVPSADFADFQRLLDAYIFGDGVILIAAFERQRHCLGHAGVGFAGWEAEIEVEVYRP